MGLNGKGKVTKLNPNGDDLRLRVVLEDPRRSAYGTEEYAHVTAQVVRVGTDGRIMYGCVYGPLEGVKASCQMSWGHDGPYAMEVQVADVKSLERAQQAVAIHGAFERHWGKMRARFGWDWGAGSMGQFTLMLAEALGIVDVGFDTGSPYGVDGFTWYTPGEASVKIDNFCRKSIAAMDHSGAAAAS